MSCTKSTDPKYVKRPSPPYPANQCPEGLIKKGNDGNKWIVKKASNGVNRWMKYTGSQQVVHSIQKPLQVQQISHHQKPIKTQSTDLKKLTILELKKLLNKHNIPYPIKAKKAELIKLLSKTTSQKWYKGLIPQNQLNKYIGYTAIYDQDVKTHQVLDDFSSRQTYQRGKRGKDSAGWQLMGQIPRQDGQTRKYYLDQYPL